MAQSRLAYRAFTVIKREGQDDFWLPIGAAFRHSHQEDGLNVVLQALPIPDRDGQCKIVLRPPKEKDDDRPPVRDERNNKSRSSQR